jgi:hypothetical protein
MTRLRSTPRRALLGFLIHDRKAKIAVSMGIGVLLVLSAVAYVALLVPGASANPPSFPPTCTTTYSSSPTYDTPTMVPITISSSGTYCFTSGETFNTQVTVTASDVTLTSTGGHQLATIKPTSVSQNSADPDTATPEYNIILVGGGSSITGETVSNLIVDGSLASTTFTSCADDYEGILFLNAGGAITGNTVQNVYLPPSLAGCQPGLGIEVQTASGHSSSVTISNNQVLNYNKNGITCNDAGTTCNVNQNTVTFYVSSVAGAPASSYAQYIAPNGIQIAYSAVGTVSDNTVSGNECNLAAPICGPDVATEYQGAGILTYESGAGTVLRGNTITGNDVGILTADDAALSTANQIQDNRYEGILLNDATYSPTNNNISCDHLATCQVAIGVDSDGYAAAPTVATLGYSNNFNGKFATALVQVVAYTGGNEGGTNSEPATLSINGFSETVTPSTCSGAGCTISPSFVNLTSIPS